MESMFDSCTNLHMLDLSTFNTEKCQNFNNMFNKADSMKVVVNQKTGKNLGEAIKDYVEVVYQ